MLKIQRLINLIALQDIKCPFPTVKGVEQDVAWTATVCEPLGSTMKNYIVLMGVPHCTRNIPSTQHAPHYIIKFRYTQSLWVPQSKIKIDVSKPNVFIDLKCMQ